LCDRRVRKTFDSSGKSPSDIHHRNNRARAGKLAAGFFIWIFRIGRRPAFTAPVYSHVGALTLGASFAPPSEPGCPSIKLDLPARANVPVRGAAEGRSRTRPREG
jgi:hypothetical protein